MTESGRKWYSQSKKGDKDLKKVAFILSLVMLLGIGQAGAEITRGEDKFTGSSTINSWAKGTDSSQLKSLYFRKYVNTSPLAYEIEASKITFRDFIFLGTFLELKIDNNPVQQLPIKEAKQMSLVRESDIYSSIIVPVPKTTVEEIGKATRIALRFQTASGSYVYVLPDAVLTEWKEVINTEK